MSKKTPPPSTLPNLFEWPPPPIVERFDEHRVRAVTLRARLDHAVSETLKTAKDEKDLSRDTIANEMSEWLGETVSKEMLDNYASEAKDDHTIPYIRILALIEVTGDTRLLQMGVELSEHAVIPDKYVAAVKDALISDQIENLKKAQRHQRAAWKGGA